MAHTGRSTTQQARKRTEPLELRDHFASIVLACLVCESGITQPASCAVVAKKCYTMADAMLAQKEKPQSS